MPGSGKGITSIQSEEEIPPMKRLTAVCVFSLLAAALVACGNPVPPDPAHDRWHADTYRGSDGGGGGGM